MSIGAIGNGTNPWQSNGTDGLSRSALLQELSQLGGAGAASGSPSTCSAPPAAATQAAAPPRTDGVSFSPEVQNHSQHASHARTHVS